MQKAVDSFTKFEIAIFFKKAATFLIYFIHDLRQGTMD